MTEFVDWDSLEDSEKDHAYTARFAVLKHYLGKENYTKHSMSHALAYDAKPLTITSSTKGKGKKVVVIGGGISGLTTAKYLLKSGFEVILLEKSNRVGGNNDPFIDTDGREYPSICIVSLPAQQPHYSSMLKEYNINHIPHTNYINGKWIDNEIKDLSLKNLSSILSNFNNLSDRINAIEIFYRLKK